MSTMHLACPTLFTTFDHPRLYVLNISSLPLCPGMNRQVITELRVLSCTVLGHQLCVFCEAVKNGSWSSLLNAQIQRHHQASQVWDKELFVDIVRTELSLTPRCCLFLLLFSTLSFRDYPILEISLLLLLNLSELIGLDLPSCCQSLIICSMLE